MKRFDEKLLYLEHQMLSWWEICPSDPVYYSEDCSILSQWISLLIVTLEIKIFCIVSTIQDVFPAVAARQSFVYAAIQCPRSSVRLKPGSGFPGTYLSYLKVVTQIWLDPLSGFWDCWITFTIKATYLHDQKCWVDLVVTGNRWWHFTQRYLLLPLG